MSQTIQINYDFSIGSLNARGLNNMTKRNAVFSWAKKHKFDMVFLQECYCSPEIENTWRQEWDGDIIFSHGSKHSKGTIIMFHKKLDFKIIKTEVDVDGRYVLCQLEIQGETFVCLNIYAPNTMHEKQPFFSKLMNTLQNLNVSSSDKIIIAGDWNSIQDVEFDKKGGNVNAGETVTESMNDLVNFMELADIWRVINPTTKRFTFRQKKPLIQSRLDYFYISHELQDYVYRADIIPSIWSDHSGILIEIKHLPEVERGKGHWKFNNSLLKDDKYVKDMTENLNEWLGQYHKMKDKRVIWELLKYHIRKFTMTFSSVKKLDKIKHEKELAIRLSVLEQNLTDKTTLYEEYLNVKNELKIIEMEKIDGMILRSKCKFVEEGEKSSKFFYGLEKTNYVKKHMRKLTVNNGDIITDQKQILHEQKTFYENLYSSKRQKDTILDFDVFLNDPSLPRLSASQKNDCEVEITLDECKESLKTFDKNKSPGTDGITVEFYDKFWHILGKPMVDCFVHAFECGELSSSQKQAIITLLEKQGKDRQFIKNWRPISLLNHDYKILTKALSIRLKKVLPTIIHPNQSAYVEGRYMGDSIRLIQDVMEYTKLHNKSGMLLLIDFQKAFDSVEHDFIVKALEIFNFGENLIKWFKLVCKNACSCVINNGISSPFFNINRGVRQGDPLSPYIFIIVIELLANYIRKNQDIQGIKVGEKEIKISLYADDITVMVKNQASGKLVFEALKKFAMCSGLKINKEKTEGIWLGHMRNNDDTPLNISWPKAPIKVLGVYLSYDMELAVKYNFEDKIEKLKKQLHWWKSRDLSLTGRVLIAKTLGLSKFALVNSMIHVPAEIITRVNKIVYEFVWKSQTDKVNRTIFAQEYVKGGFKMTDMNTLVKAAKIKWISRFLECKEKDWKFLFQLFAKKKRLDIFLMSNFDIKEIQKLHMPIYYLESIQYWYNCKEYMQTYQDNKGNQLIWYNKNFKVDSKTVFNDNLLRLGIWSSKDLYKEGKLIPFTSWQSRGASVREYLGWRNIVACVSPEVKALINLKQDIAYPCFGNDENPIIIHSAKEKDIKCFLNITAFRQIREEDFKVKNKLIRIFGDMDHVTWQYIYSLPHDILKCNKVKELQYKILYRYIGTNRLLFKIKINPSPRCSFCELYTESIEHLFYDCFIVKNLWLQLQQNWNDCHSSNMVLKQQDIILGYNIHLGFSSLINQAINIVILYGKYYIFKCKLENESPLCFIFKIKLKDYLRICNYDNRIMTLINRAFV